MIRAATLADANALGRVHVRSWQVGYRGLVPQEYLDGLDPTERSLGWACRLAAPDPERVTYVLELEGAVQGFGACGPGRDPDAPGVGELFAIYLDPAVWRAGHGRALFQRCQDDLRGRGLRELTVWVLRGNERARGFYGGMGLAPDGAEKEVVQQGIVLDEVRYRGAL